MPQQLPTYEDLFQQLSSAHQEVLRLKEENSALRKALEENDIKQRLKDLQSIGVSNTIVTREENEHTSILSACGFDVMVRQSLSLCCTIIDKHIVWYGCINPLAYVAEDDTAMRIEDAEIAGEMMEVVFGDIK